MVCSHCGASMAATERACLRCGRALVTDDRQTGTHLPVTAQDSDAAEVTRLAGPVEVSPAHTEDSRPGASTGPSGSQGGPPSEESTRLTGPSDHPVPAPEHGTDSDATRFTPLPDASPSPPSPVGAGDDSGPSTTGHGPAAAQTGAGSPPASAPGGSTGHRAPAARGTGPLQLGTPFGRYHLIRLLGAGGMGAVYQAWDEELGVVVALKVIRPEAMANPADARELERRFKRELLLARNVTDKHVIRIHDLGEIDGIKYITMPYVNGSDLATILKREGRLHVARAVAFARQIATGLVAAHDAGIVHRDLKPANILIDEEDHALITDFGIARSVGPGAGAGATVVGTVVGTLEYMAPEQARAEPVDHRADIYAFGLMLSDMLTGRRERASGDSAFADLIERIGKPLPSIRGIDPDLPAPLDAIVARCGQPDPAQRYQRTQDLLADLTAVTTEGHTSVSRPHPAVTTPAATAGTPPPSATITFTVPAALAGATSRRWLVAAAVVLVTAVAGVAYWFSPAFGDATVENAPPAESLRLAVLPFRNESGRSELDRLELSLDDELVNTIGQSGALSMVSTGTIAQLLDDLRIPRDSNFAPERLAQLAELSSATSVLWGRYTTYGNEIQISATLLDVEHQRRQTLEEKAPDEAGLLEAIGRLATKVRDSLSLSQDAKAQLARNAFAPTTGSLTALGYYTEGVELSRTGRHQEAVEKFQASVDEDGRFALAFAGMAEAYAALGRRSDAEREAQRAASLADAATPQEQYLIRASRERILGNTREAIDYYEQLEPVLPSEEVLLALGALFRENSAFDSARQRYDRLLERDAKHVDALVGRAMVEIGTGNAGKALDFLTRAQAAASERGNDALRATVLWTFGVAYRVLEQPKEAIRYYQDALEVNRELGRDRGVADSLHGLAELQNAIGERNEALENFEAAREIRERIDDQQGIGNLLIDLGNLYADGGDYAKALDLLKQALAIQHDLRNDRYEALALNNIADIYRVRGEHEEARVYLERALTLREKLELPRDIADSLHNLAENGVRIGDFRSAELNYLKALAIRREIGDKSGEAIEHNSLGTVKEYQGLYGAARDSRAEAVRIFRDTGERGLWLARLLAAQAGTLIASGQATEAATLLAEVQDSAQQLQSDELTAQLHVVSGEGRLLSGNYAEARARFEQALKVASRARLREFELASRLALRKIDVLEGRPQAAVAPLTSLVEDGRREGLRLFAAESSLYLGRALLDLGQHAEAQKQLASALAAADRLGALVLKAKANALLARSYSASGRAADARRHTEAARAQLETIEKEAGTDDVLRRADLQLQLPAV